jgi:hypothetical protein
MGAKTNYLENKVIDWLFRGQAFTPPATIHFALIRATAGVSPRSTAVTVGQTTVPATHNGRMYRCSTAGTTGGSEPTWTTTDNATTTDGTAVWTEMTNDFETESAVVTGAEVTGGSYARASLAASLANFAGTQSSGSTTASTGTSGTTSNNVAVTFPAPTANWGVVAAVLMEDAATAGNALTYGVLNLPKTINNGDLAPSFAIAALSYQEDN